MTTDRFQKGREALFGALSGICDEIEAGLREDQQAQALDFQATHRAHLDQIEKLRAENEAMREQLAELQSSVKTQTEINPPSAIENALPKQSVVSSALPPTPVVPESSTPAAVTSCQGNCSKVLRRYHAVAANFKTAKEALQRRKMERLQWARHATYLTTKLREAEEQYDIKILDHQAPLMDAPPAIGMEAEERALDPTLSFISDDGPSEAEPELPAPLSKDVPDGNATTAPGTSSQTTQGEASEENSLFGAAHMAHGSSSTPIKRESSSDVPEVIMERKVSHRKRAHDEIESDAKMLVKPEVDDDSGPNMSTPAAKPSTQESLDLGDIAQRVQTPRKRPLLEQDGPQTDITSRFKLGAVTPLNAQPPRKSQSARVPRQQSALMPLDGNLRLIKPTNEKRAGKDRRRQLHRGIAVLAEDCYVEEEIDPTRAAEESRASANKRLDFVLNGGIEETDVIAALTPNMNELPNPGWESAFRVPRRRQLPFDLDENRYNLNLHGPRKPAMHEDTESRSRPSMPKPDNRPSVGMLRHKLPSDLHLSDFKVNPSANEGHDFAFSEVVRDRANRACLPGCVDMHCCGSMFRAMAIAQRPNSPLTSAQEEEEQKLLEDYLGASSHRLTVMDREQRMELWIKAKTQELANKFGKHKHRFPRMQSPPGFWNADFPNTQQLKADREEALKRTEHAIAERYREALRPGGRWRFMDE
ncbi:hypothetical protein E4U27_005540 [Claviceps purpurea]|nr:hypothetical protein E4U27_005540 [Claviceps purpurea]